MRPLSNVSGGSEDAGERSFRDAWNALIAVVRGLQKMAVAPPLKLAWINEQPLLSVDIASQWSIIGKNSGAISARSGTTPGSGTVQPYRRNSSGTLETYGPTFTVYNLSADAVPDDKWIMCKRDYFGDWWVDFEDCA